MLKRLLALRQSTFAIMVALTVAAGALPGEDPSSHSLMTAAPDAIADGARPQLPVEGAATEAAPNANDAWEKRAAPDAGIANSHPALTPGESRTDGDATTKLEGWDKKEKQVKGWRAEFPEPLPEVESTPLGWTPGFFSVDQKGAASYTIPIVTPPGRNGIGPNLTLTYNSLAGDGPLGTGWSISGLSMIHRGGRDLRFDDELHPIRYDNNDSFSLDGNRLVPVVGENGEPGTEYRTKLNTFSKIVSHGSGPDYFLVYTKSGLILTYGDPSAVYPEESSTYMGVPGVPLAWALSEVRDRSGNYMYILYDNRRLTFDEWIRNSPYWDWLKLSDETWESVKKFHADKKFYYTDPTVELLPKLIAYTGHDTRLPKDAVRDPNQPGQHPRRWVLFQYEERPDPRYGFVAGGEFRNTMRLDYITTGVSATSSVNLDGKERTYGLCYSNEPECYDGAEPNSRSLLVSITEIDKNDVKKKPTIFQWSHGTTSYSAHNVRIRRCGVDSTDPDYYGSSPYRGFFSDDSAVLDINGDGLQDLLSRTRSHSRDDDDCHYNNVRFGKGDASVGDLMTGNCYENLEACHWRSDAYWRADHQSVVPVDYNGDGLTDILSMKREELEHWTWAFLDNWNQLEVADCDRYSYEEFLGGGEHSEEAFYEYLNSEQAWILDNCRTWLDRNAFGYWDVQLNLGTGEPPFFSEPVFIPLEIDPHLRIPNPDVLVQSPAVLSDINGDGLVDYITTAKAWGEHPPWNHVFYRLNKGDGFGPLTALDYDDRYWEGVFEVYGPYEPLENVHTDWFPLLVDHNGDGATDLFIGNEGSYTSGYLAITFTNGDVVAKTSNLPLLQDRRYDKRDLYTGDNVADITGRVLVLDSNGDGLDDILVLSEADNGCVSDGRLWFNTGAKEPHFLGGEEGFAAFETSIDVEKDCYDVLGSVDSNGDGAQDLIVREDSLGDHSVEWYAVILADQEYLGGEVYGELVTIGETDSTDIRIADFDGNYSADFVIGNVLYASDKTPPLITKVRDGRILDNDAWSLIVEYRPTSDESVCTLDSHELEEAAVPPREGSWKQKPRTHVVASYSLDNGRDTKPVTYRRRYYDPRVDRIWGALGFGQVEEIEENTGATSVWMFDNHYRDQPGAGGFPNGFYPELGLLKRYEVQVPLENGASYTVSARNVYSTHHDGGTTYFPYLSSSTIRGWWNFANGGRTMLLGSRTNLVKPEGSRAEIDDYGNVLAYERRFGSTGTSPAYRVEVNTGYRNNLETWVIGLPEFQTVLFEPPDAPSTLQTYKWDYYDNGLLRWQVREPNDDTLDYQQEWTFNYYDDGNLEEVYLEAAQEGMEPEERLVASLVYDEQEHIFIEEIRNALDHTNRFLNDPMGRVLLFQSADGTFYRNQYDGFGRLAAFEDLQTEWAVERTLDSVDFAGGKHLRITTNGTDGSASRMLLDRLHRPVLVGDKQFNGEFAYRQLTYNRFGEISRDYAPQYGDLDDWTPHSSYFQYDYDNLGRIASLTGTDGSEIGVTYEGNEATLRQKTGEDPSVPDSATYSTTIRHYDQLGRPTEITDALGQIWQYKYGKLGLLKEVLDPKWNLYHFKYDDYGRLTGIGDPSAGDSTMDYDGFDQLSWTMDHAGCQTRFEYDPIGRLEYTTAEGKACCGEDDCVEDRKYTYDEPGGLQATGKLVSANSLPWNHSVKYAFNTHGQLESATRLINDQQLMHSFTYDRFGRLKRHAYPPFVSVADGSAGYHKGEGSSPNSDEGFKVPSPVSVRFTVFYDYNEHGHLRAVSNYDHNAPPIIRRPQNAVDFLEIVETDAAGLPTHVRSGNGIETRYAYEPLTGRLKDIDSSLQDLHYAYYPDGRMSLREDRQTNVRETFTYDELGRLEDNTLYSLIGKTMGQELETSSYEFDSIGNITFRSDLGQLIYDETSERPYWIRSLRTQDGRVLEFDHDDNGNLVSLPCCKLTYTSFAKPKTITDQKTGDMLILEYDGLGERVVKAGPGGDTWYAGPYLRIAGSNETIHRYDAGNAIVDRIPTDTGYDEIVRYVHRDHLGSPHVVTGPDVADSQGRLYFAPYGTPRSGMWHGDETELRDSGIVAGFTGHEHDEDLTDDLINMRGREYDPHLGRFLSPDPVIQFPELGQSYNAYSYVLNSPLTYTDPSGYGIFEYVVEIVQSLTSGGACGGSYSGGGVGDPFGNEFEGYTWDIDLPRGDVATDVGGSSGGTSGSGTTTDTGAPSPLPVPQMVGRFRAMTFLPGETLFRPSVQGIINRGAPRTLYDLRGDPIPYGLAPIVAEPLRNARFHREFGALLMEWGKVFMGTGKHVGLSGTLIYTLGQHQMNLPEQSRALLTPPIPEPDFGGPIIRRPGMTTLEAFRQAESPEHREWADNPAVQDWMFQLIFEEHAPFMFAQLGHRVNLMRRAPAGVPNYTGRRVGGLLTTETGVEFEFVSGQAGGAPWLRLPGRGNVIKWHVEAHAAQTMRLVNSMKATLRINKMPCLFGKGGGCENMLPSMLSPGARLRVIGPGGYDKTFTGVADPKGWFIK